MFFDSLSLSEEIKKLSQETIATSSFNRLINEFNKVLSEYKSLFEQNNKINDDNQTNDFKKFFSNSHKEEVNQSLLSSKIEETKVKLHVFENINSMDMKKMRI